MTDDLDEEIDQLALEIEQSIQHAKEVNERFEGVFESRYKQVEADAKALFS